MFQQLIPLLRQRSVLLTVTSLEDDQIRVNVIPKKLKEGENSALTTPMSFTGTAAELDEQLPDAIVSFVASHLELKNTLARAKEEMDAAAKAAQEERALIYENWLHATAHLVSSTRALPSSIVGGDLWCRLFNWPSITHAMLKLELTSFHPGRVVLLGDFYAGVTEQD